MSINAKVDGQIYDGITNISVGGKNIALEEIGTSGESITHKQVTFVQSTIGTETLRSSIYYDFGADGVPDIIEINTNDTSAGYVQKGVFSKKSGHGVVNGINKSTNTMSKNPYTFEEKEGLTITTSIGNLSACYYGGLCVINQASTNVSFNDAMNIVADCYWLS